MKDLVKQAIVAASVAVIFLAVQALAFTEPSSAPPAGDVAAPLNTGGSTQDKSGWFTFQGGGTRADTYLATQSGKVGVGTTSPRGNLDVENANNTATACLNGSCITRWPAGASGYSGSFVVMVNQYSSGYCSANGQADTDEAWYRVSYSNGLLQSVSFVSYICSSLPVGA